MTTGPLGKYRNPEPTPEPQNQVPPVDPGEPGEPLATETPAPETTSPAADQQPTLAFLMAEIDRLRRSQEEQIKAMEEKAKRDLAAADEAAGIRVWPDEHGVRCIGKTNARGDWEPVQCLESGIILQEIQVPAKSSDPIWPARVLVCAKGVAPETLPRSLTSILKDYTDNDWNSLRDAVRDCRSPEREQEYQELRAEQGSQRGKASAASRRKY